MEEDQQAGPCFNEPLLPISSSDRPAPPDHHRPACSEPSNIGAQWRAAALLLGAHCLQSLAISGCTVNLVVFLVDVLDEDAASAANAVTNWTGASLLLSVLGAAIGDLSSIGHVGASVICHAIFTAGSLAFAAVASAEANGGEGVGRRRVVGFYASLYAMGAGSASSTPNTISMGAGLFPRPGQRSAFVTLYMASTNAGLFAAMTCVAYAQSEGRWALGFAISGGAGVASLVLLLAAAAQIRALEIARAVVAVVVAAAIDPEHEAGIGDVGSVIDSSDHRYRAKSIMESDRYDRGESDRDRYDRRGAKGIGAAILPFWACAVVVCTATAQSATLFVLQGATMDNGVALLGVGSFELPAASMGLFSILAIVIAAPAYTWLVAPRIASIRRGIGPNGEPSPVERMGIGIATAIAAFSGAAIVESRRLSMIAHMGDLDPHDDHDHGKAMSIFWLAPQYVLAGLTTLFFGAGNVDFNHANSGPGLRSLATAAFLSAMALGSFGSSLIVHAVSSLTPWLPPDLNSGHLDYFYSLLVALLVLAAALFAIFSTSHSRRIARPSPDPIGSR